MNILVTLRNRGNLMRLVFVIAMVAWPLLFRSEYTLAVMVVAGLYGTMALGLAVLMGQAGQISLGHATFFGIGAYTAALFTLRLNLPPLLALLASGVVSALCAYFVGRPLLRLKSFILALATLGFGEIFYAFVRENAWLTKGGWGIVGIPWLELGGFAIDDYFRQYYLVWAFLLALVFFTERALGSRVGRTLRALAISDAAASTLGIYTVDWKLRAFVISAAYAGIGGGLYAFALSAITPEDFSVLPSITVIVMATVGGISSPFGTVFGAILLTWLSRSFSAYQEYSGLLYAVLLVLLVLFLPGGLAGGLRSAQAGQLRSLLALLTGWWNPQASRSLAKDGAIHTAPKALAATGSQIAGRGRTQTTALRGVGALLRLEEVNVSFGGLQALSQVSLVVPEGSISSLIGPNGAGKTTLFNVVSGLHRVSGGRVWFADQEITQRSATDIARLGMARTFQNLRIFGNMTVLENVMVGRHRHERAGFLAAGLGTGWQVREERRSRERSLQALALVRLDHLSDWPAMSLPYGQQRLVEVARALATEPRLLLLDEPAAGLNSSERVHLRDTLARIRDAGVTVLLVEHDVNLVMDVSNAVSVLDYGKLISSGKPEDVQADPAVTRAYLGVGDHSLGVVGQGRGVDVASRRYRPAEAGSSPLKGLPKGEVLLQVDDITTCYGSIVAVRGVSLEVRSGEIVVVLGPNGAGKTTLLRTISGVLRHRGGRILLGDHEITGLTPAEIVASGIGHVPEGRHVFPTLSVQDNLLLGAPQHRGRAKIDMSYEYVYSLFPRLAERRRQIAGTLSGGEQQMLAIGRALMAQPKLLLLDEPSMGLAPGLVGEIFKTIGNLAAEGVTMLLVEQSAREAMSVANRGYVLETGTVALAGDARHLMASDEVARIYLGDRRKVLEVST